ncbi:MAG TPA: hypothetical protein VNR89_19850 [Roseomonas sp.]|nr:hypothetical protein [Roseomonas sp.]
MSIIPALALSIISASGWTYAQWRSTSPAAAPLSRSDLDRQSAAANKLLQATPPPVGRSETWTNPATGRSGNITLLDTSQGRRGPCRRLQFEVTGREDATSYVFKLCQVSGGQWKIME